MPPVAGGKETLGRRIALFPLPLQGHLNPMFQLATLLYDRGFSITIVHTHFNAPDPTNYPNFEFKSIPDGLSPELIGSTDIIKLINILNINIEGPFHDRMAKMLSEENAKDPIACLIVDVIMHSTRAVAERLKLPRIVVRTSSAACFNVFTAFPLLWEKGYFPIDDPRCENPVEEIPPLRVRDLPDFRKSHPEDIFHLVTQTTESARASSGAIWNTFESLEITELEKLQQELQVPIFPIGPFLKFSSSASSSLLAQDRACMEWLDKQVPGSVLYVSFGSLACMDEEEFLETAWGLANTHLPFLWVLRPGLVLGSAEQPELPQGFEEETRGRGRVLKWAFQQEVLAHPAVGAFWTHCGWNSTLESICEGVPMLCWPCFGDQKVNARYLGEVWKVGIQLEKRLQRGDIERAVRRLMTEKEGEEMRERVRDLKADAERCVEEGGSSCDSLNRLVDLILSFCCCCCCCCCCSSSSSTHTEADHQSFVQRYPLDVLSLCTEGRCLSPRVCS